MRYRGVRFFVMIFLTACLPIGRTATAQTLQALRNAAKAEGQVIIWSPMDVQEMQLLTEAFYKDFPGVKVNHFEIRETDYVPRIIAESRQGIVSLDVGTTKYVAAAPLIERDLIQRHTDWTKIFKDLNPAAISKDGRFLANDDLAFIVAYNTKLVKPGDVPTSWDDLLAPKWKGKLLVEPRANAFAYLGLKWGKEKTAQYVRKLKAQNPTFVKGGTTLFQQLVAGAGEVAVGGYVHRVLQLQQEGAPIDWAKKVTPIGAMPQDIFVMKGAKHPNAAKLFSGWLASERAQNIMNQKLFRGALNAGSSYVAVREFEKHHVEIVKEHLQNYKIAVEINQLAARTLGTFK
ncbi:MAG TPA: extracellular solute-binding protein [Candidatus Eisenbacteria bacterium]|nr:extracellular solute-binding protein [Candidatus Eisenbacteria bacterium]